jgi:hypothetical protein
MTPSATFLRQESFLHSTPTSTPQGLVPPCNTSSLPSWTKDSSRQGSPKETSVCLCPGP